MTYSDVSLMIDGAWTKGANGRTIPVINPATEEVIGQVAHAEKSDLDRALAAADKGFKQWRKVSAYERYKIMRKAADLMRQRLDEIATDHDHRAGQAAVRGQGRDQPRRRHHRLDGRGRPPHLRPHRAGARRERVPARA